MASAPSNTLPLAAARCRDAGDGSCGAAGGDAGFPSTRLGPSAASNASNCASKFAFGRTCGRFALSSLRAPRYDMCLALMRYASTTVADLLTPWTQCTNTAPQCAPASMKFTQAWRCGVKSWLLLSYTGTRMYSNCRRSFSKKLATPATGSTLRDGVTFNTWCTLCLCRNALSFAVFLSPIIKVKGCENTTLIAPPGAKKKLPPTSVYKCYDDPDRCARYVSGWRFGGLWVNKWQ